MKIEDAIKRYEFWAEDDRIDELIRRDHRQMANWLKELEVDRPQGEWIPATWQDENCPERLKRHKCSNCGQRAEQILIRTELVDNYYYNKAEPITEYTHKEQLSKYCPNCGADMRGGRDD